MSMLPSPRWALQSAAGIGAVALFSIFVGIGAPSADQAPAKGIASADPTACAPGFSGSPAAGCVDVNECAVSNGGCNRFSECTNTPGSRTCSACPEKFAGDGYLGCFDANECPNGDCTARLPLGFETALPPVITTSGDMTVAAASAKGAVAKFTASAKEKIDGDRTVTCQPASGSTFPVGKTTVGCWAVSSLGKLKQTTLAVTVTKK
ncbi:MAG: calcium-binding EGF-like domain-containing protein [Acidobacteriota bacterium]